MFQTARVDPTNPSAEYRVFAVEIPLSLNPPQPEAMFDLFSTWASSGHRIMKCLVEYAD